MPNYIYMGHVYDKLIKNSETHENDFDYQYVPSWCNYLTIIKTAMTGDLRSVLNLIKINSTNLNYGVLYTYFGYKYSEKYMIST